MSAAEPLWLPLGELLVQHGLLSARQLELALVEQRRTGRKLGEVLVTFGFVSEQVLSATLLEQVGLAAEAPGAEPEPERGREPELEHDREDELLPEPVAALEPEPAPEPEPHESEAETVATPLRRAGHLAEAEEQPRAVVVRVEELGHLDDRAARVAHLEAVVGDFERRSAEIQTRIAEVRGVLAELKS